MIWPGIGEPLVSIRLNDRDTCDSSGRLWSLRVETCLLFWLCGIAWDESIAIDKVSASDEKVDPVDCVDKSHAGFEVCQLCCLFEPISIMFGIREMECSTENAFSYCLLPQKYR